MEEYRYSLIIVDFGITWRLVISFTLRPLYLRGKRAPHLFVRVEGGP
jgi:hypothetical protein